MHMCVCVCVCACVYVWMHVWMHVCVCVKQVINMHINATCKVHNLTSMCSPIPMSFLAQNWSWNCVWVMCVQLQWYPGS